jgi:hypothetical protein
MPARRTRRLSDANVTSSLALFIALGGVSWAAATLPANSVGKRQLKDNAVTGRKPAGCGLRARRAAGGSAGPGRSGWARGEPGAKGDKGDRGEQGPAGAVCAVGPAGAAGPAATHAWPLRLLSSSPATAQGL